MTIASAVHCYFYAVCRGHCHFLHQCNCQFHFQIGCQAFICRLTIVGPFIKQIICCLSCTAGNYSSSFHLMANHSLAPSLISLSPLSPIATIPIFLGCHTMNHWCLDYGVKCLTLTYIVLLML